MTIKLHRIQSVVVVGKEAIQTRDYGIAKNATLRAERVP
jgi:hypothetical protein